jgi:glycosyltransferase involved in cell wall biosynthesis
LRIFFAVHGYKPAWRVGGPIISVSSLAESLVRRGHKVIVFTSNSNLDRDLDVPINRPVDVDGVEVWYFERQEPLQRWFQGFAYLSKSMGFLYSPKMAKALDEVIPSVDLIHTHLPFNYPTYAAAHAAFRHQKPLFYHQRGVFDPERLKFRSLKKSVYLRLIEVPILKRATTLIALTETEVEHYRRLGLKTPCRVIPNGIDTGTTAVSVDPLMLKTVGVGPQHILILFLGRIHPIKGADLLLQAFCRVQHDFPNAVLVMAGPDEFGLEKSFKQLAEAAGLTHRVIFPGMVHGKLKAQLLSRADLFCLPSSGEGFSMAILEALANNTAVLISPGCHFPEVEHAGAGRIVELNHNELSKALSRMLSDAPALKKMGIAGRRLVAEKFSWDIITEKLLDTYAEGMDRYSKRSNQDGRACSQEVISLETH